jgi:hypothetical protein
MANSFPFGRMILSLSVKCASIVASPIDTDYPHSAQRTLDGAAS